MKCIICNSEIEKDDNFCHHCGHWTARGYTFFNKNEENIKILEGNARNLENKTTTLFILVALLIILFAFITIVRGNEILKPFIYIKKKALNYKYGYKTSLIYTYNEYHNVNIDNLNDAYTIIEKDISYQEWQCKDNMDNYHIIENLKNKYNINTISFCDMETEEVKKIEKVIDDVLSIFPNTKGYLDTISITNAKNKDEYVAYFQPIYQFVNRNEDINKYNKVNKTQILLNSYYFLNNDILSKKVTEVVGDGFYVKNATWESLIAHELGHYISFVALLKEKNISNITLITKENEEIFNNLITTINENNFSKTILNEALNNYNKKYNLNINEEEFTKNISEYANAKDTNGNLIPDETIAEAIHDYYLHKNNASPSSLEIINILKEKLSDK